MISGLKSSVAKAIWQVKIKMVEHVQKEDAGFWNVVGWCDTLAKLIGKQVFFMKDPMGQVENNKKGEEKYEEKNEEAKVTPVGGDQTVDSI